MKNRPEHLDLSRKGFITWKGYSMPFAMALAAASGQAATLTWDSDANFANGSTDGLGTWNTLLANWNNGAADVIWPNTTGDIAVFGNGGTAGEVAVSGTINVGTIRFNGGVTGNYLLSGGTLNGLGTISLGQSGVTTSTISSAITRAGGLGLSSGTAASALNLSGALNVTSIALSNLSTITLSGSTPNVTGNITIDSGGSGNVSTLILGKTAGVTAISGDISMGHYGGSGRLQLAASDQIADTATVSLNAGGIYGNHATFSLMGNNETIGWLQGTNSRGANTMQNGGATDAVLTFAGDGLTKTAINGGANGSFTIQNGSGGGKLSIVKNGTGTQVFQNGNVFNTTYTGTTTINQGTLSLRGIGAFNSSPTVVAGGTFDLQTSTVNAAISGTTGQVTVTGGTNSNFGGSNKTYSGDTVLSAASTSLTQTAANSFSANSIHNIGTGASLITGNLAGSVKALTGAGTVNLNGAAANLTVADGSGQTFSGTVTGTGRLSKSGAGTQTLTGSVLHTGGTTINGGVLQIGGTATLNGGNSSGNITNTGTLQFSSSANQTLSGNISGVGGALVKDTGAGTLTLGGTNSYSGGTVVSTGTVVATNGSALGSNGGLTLSGGHLTYNPSVAGALNLGSGVLNFADGSRIGASVGGALSQSAITSSAAAVTTGTITVDIYGVSSAPATFGVNNLITAASGLNGATYLLGNVYNATNFSIVPGSLKFDDGMVVSIDITSLPALADEYWKGGFAGGNNVWALSNGTTASNWASDMAGTVTSQTPGPTTTVRFSSTGATQQGAMTLGGDMSVAGVVIDDSVPMTLNADAYALTIGAGGLSVNGPAGAATLNATIKLGVAQAWTNNAGSTLTVGGDVTNGGFTLTAGGSGNTAITGALKGTGGLTKAGSGTLSLSGSNTHAGVTLVNEGTLALAGVNALATSTLDVGTPGAQQVTFTVAGNNTYAVGGLQGSDDLALGGNTISVGANGANTNFAGALSGSGGSLTKVGAGTLTLSGGNSHTGTTTVSAGILNLASASVSVSGVFVMNGPDGTYARMQQPGQFGPGVVANQTSASVAWNRFELFGKSQTLAGINTGNASTQGGGIIQNSETNGAAGANATLTLNGSGTYLYNGHFRDWGNTAAGTNKLGLIKEGAGTQTLQGTVISYSGATTVNAGLLKLVDTTNFKSAIHNAATVELNAVGGLAIGGTGANLTGSGIWNKTGPGIAQINGGQLVSLTGQINVQAGTLQNNNNAVNWSETTAGISVSGGAILDLYADAITLGALTGSGFVQNNYGNATGQSGSAPYLEKLVLGMGGASGTFAGAIRDNATNAALGGGVGKGGIEVVKDGAGVQVLTGTNTYTGGTMVKQGTLLVHGSLRAAGWVTVSSGATFGGAGTAGNATLEDGAFLAPGNEDFTANQLNLSSLALSDLSILSFDLDGPKHSSDFTPPFYSDFVEVGGSLVLDGKLRINPLGGFFQDPDYRWMLMTYPTGVGALADNGLELDLANSPGLPAAPAGFKYAIDTTTDGYVFLALVVPEPGTGALLALGLALLARMRRRA